MSRRVFDSTVLLLLVVLMCCGGAATAEVENNADASTSGSALTGAITAEGSVSGGVEKLQRVDLFVPQTTQVLPKTGTTDSSLRHSFASPSLVSAGGVIAAFAEGHMNAEYQCGQLIISFSSDVVAGYIDSVWNWSTVVGEVNKRIHGGHTLCLVQRRERRVWVLCSAPQQSRRATECFLLRETLPCVLRGCVLERGRLGAETVCG
ncbi:putative trans-sialidase [Trypanosoma cruzi Dm28c]|uniref:Putative trans-sialidase n=1 Tax=Trypanosoma cruzi Dm28c TaxID=1416333 RepID=V5AUR7_TRYCR|nr:putative trans-sialidase [Trypanosoma cruzi Dm28c]